MMKPMYQVVVNDPQAMMEMNAALTRMAPTHAKICSALEEHIWGFLLTSLMRGCAEMKREVVSQRKILLVASSFMSTG